jgi:hypothetical protein
MQNLWVEECLKLNMDGHKEQARNLLKSKFPQRIFKYRPLNDYTLENLEEENFYMSTIIDINDPYDFYPSLDFNRQFYLSISDKKHVDVYYKLGITKIDLYDVKQSEDTFTAFANICAKKGIPLPETKQQCMDRVFSNFYNELEKKRGLFRLQSFSEINNSTIMWSHYADVHRGICIEYDPIDIDFKYPLLPVEYSNKLFCMPDFEELDVKQRDLAIYKSFLIKAYDWNYEHEWRLLYPEIDTVDMSNKIYIKAPKPKAIYLGKRFEENSSYKKTLLSKFIDKNNITTHTMKLDYHEYKMRIYT